MFGEKKYLVREDFEVCTECGCLIDKDVATKVENYYDGAHSNSYFCKMHKKPYKKSVLDYEYNKKGLYTGRRIMRYYAQIEVDEKGKPIKK